MFFEYKSLDKEDLYVESLTNEYKKDIKTIHQFNIRKISIEFIEEKNQEYLELFINKIKEVPSPYILTNDFNDNIINLDFKLFDLNKIVEYKDDYRIKKQDFYINNQVAITENFEYVYDDKNLLEQSKSVIKWYKFNGDIGIEKERVKKYNSYTDKKNEDKQRRTIIINSIEEELYDKNSKIEVLQKMELNKNDFDNFINGSDDNIKTIYEVVLGLNKIKL